MKWIGKMFRQLFYVYRHEFYLTFHDGGIILFFLFLPFAYPVLYSLIYNPEVVRDVKMIVVDHDRSSKSRELVRRMDATQEAWVIGYAADLNEARRAMDNHDCYAILEIPENFGKRIGRLETGNAVMYCEMSLLLRYRGFLVAATNVAMDLGAEITTERLNTSVPLAETVSSGDIMPIGNITMGDIKSGFDSFIMPGIVILILHQCLVLATCMAGGAKREDPRLIGYRPVNEMPSVLMTMLGQMLCYITIIYVPTMFLYHYVPLLFKFPMAGNPFEEMMFVLPMVIAALSLGFVMQGFTAQRESVFIFWVVTSVMFLFLSGLTWPRYAMPGFWKFLSDIVPATWGIEGFIRMNSNGASLAQVRDPYIYLWIQAGVYFVIAYFVHRWAIRPKLRPYLKVSEA